MWASGCALHWKILPFTRKHVFSWGQFRNDVQHEFPVFSFRLLTWLPRQRERNENTQTGLGDWHESLHLSGRQICRPFKERINSPSQSRWGWSATWENQWALCDDLLIWFISLEEPKDHTSVAVIKGPISCPGGMSVWRNCSVTDCSIFKLVSEHWAHKQIFTQCRGGKKERWRAAMLKSVAYRCVPDHFFPPLPEGAF